MTIQKKDAPADLKQGCPFYHIRKDPPMIHGGLMLYSSDILIIDKIKTFKEQIVI